MILAKDVLEKYGKNAFAYGGYRTNSREIVPSVDELKEDMRILNTLDCHLIRTYHTQQFGQVRNLLQAIKELNQEEESFYMYVMLGAWIQCKKAWTDNPVREEEDLENNRAEIDQAIAFAEDFPEIVKIIAVGNEAMVHWAYGYYVQPSIILKYVEELQYLKKSAQLDSSIWITSSDNFASWGGGSNEYHNSELAKLIKAVDYVSLHTYPFHDTHYNNQFWIDSSTQIDNEILDAKKAVNRAVTYAKNQYANTKKYVQSISKEKEVHIGETGWSTMDNNFYGKNGSGAADEIKQAYYYQKIRKWTQENKIACFYFEAFDEPWKDQNNVNGSENHFGLISLNGKVKMALWEDFKKFNMSKLRRIETLKKSFNGDSLEAYNSLLSVPHLDSLVIN